MRVASNMTWTSAAFSLVCPSLLCLTLLHSSIRNLYPFHWLMMISAYLPILCPVPLSCWEYWWIFRLLCSNFFSEVLSSWFLHQMVKKAGGLDSIWLTVRDTARKVWWTQLEILYSMMWLIKLKTKITRISTMRINHLGDVPKDSITRWEIMNNMHIHCPVAADSGLGCSWMSTAPSRFILLGSCKQTKFPVARRGGGAGALGVGGQAPAPYGPGRA